MNQCPLCGCSASQNEATCPACFTSLEPRELTWDEMKERLVAAGWKVSEAEQEIQSMKEDEESGM